MAKEVRNANFASGSVLISGYNSAAVSTACSTLVLYQLDALPLSLRAAIASIAKASDIMPSLLVSFSKKTGLSRTLLALA